MIDSIVESGDGTCEFIEQSNFRNNFLSLRWGDADILGRLAFDATTAHLVGAFFAGFGTAIALDAIATFASIERMSGLETDELITEGTTPSREAVWEQISAV